MALYPRVKLLFLIILPPTIPPTARLADLGLLAIFSSIICMVLCSMTSLKLF